MVRGMASGAQPVAEAVEQLAQLVGGQQVEQHQHVGLLGDLVVVDGVALGLEDAVEPADVAVAAAVASQSSSARSP